MPTSSLMQSPLFLVPFGLFVGIFSGLMGLGGGAVIIPVLVLVFAFDQQSAHGTSLAMILSPTALPAIWNYHQKGFVDWRLVLWVLPGMLVGSYVGSQIATYISQQQLKLVFGFVLVYVACYTIFGKEHLTRTLLLSLAIVLLTAAAWGVTRWLDAARAPAQ